MPGNSTKFLAYNAQATSKAVALRACMDLARYLNVVVSVWLIKFLSRSGGKRQRC